MILRPHQCYYQPLKGLFKDKGLKGLAHITGGGIQDNLSRILPETCQAVIDLALLQVLPIFKTIRAEGLIPEDDMLRTFNMGVGMTLVCAQNSVARINAHLQSAGCHAYPIGRMARARKMLCSREKFNGERMGYGLRLQNKRFLLRGMGG